MEKQIRATPVFLKNYEAYHDPKVRIIVNQGGSSSTKTYSILQVLKRIADEEKRQIEVCALTVPHYKSGALQDFISILSDLDEYDTERHNKSDQIFNFDSESTIKFSAYDQEGKARGPRRDILFINEINLFDERTVAQLLLRTRHKIFVDYNPADEFHWVYEKILTRSDIAFIQSTYLEGYDFLSPQTISEIESLKDTDPDLWKVYGLGERGVGRNKIYTNWSLIDDMPYSKMERSIGVDFGFNNPSAVVDCGLYDDNVYWDELIYERGLTTPALIQRMEEVNTPKNVPMYCDNAEPDRITELQNAGFNALSANKSVKAGIDFIRGIEPDRKEGQRFKGRKLFITKKSINIRKEISQYKNKEDKKSHITDEPVKFMDHAMDAGRYGSYTHYLTLINQTDFSDLIYL